MKYLEREDSIVSIVAVGSSQIILSMQNLERTCLFVKESKAFLLCLQYKQSAGPEKVPKSRFSKNEISGPEIKIQYVVNSEHNIGLGISK